MGAPARSPCFQPTPNVPRQFLRELLFPFLRPLMTITPAPRVSPPGGTRACSPRPRHVFPFNLASLARGFCPSRGDGRGSPRVAERASPFLPRHLFGQKLQMCTYFAPEAVYSVGPATEVYVCGILGLLARQSSALWLSGSFYPPPIHLLVPKPHGVGVMTVCTVPQDPHPHPPFLLLPSRVCFCHTTSPGTPQSSLTLRPTPLRPLGLPMISPPTPYMSTVPLVHPVSCWARAIGVPPLILIFFFSSLACTSWLFLHGDIPLPPFPRLLHLGLREQTYAYPLMRSSACKDVRSCGGVGLHAPSSPAFSTPAPRKSDASGAITHVPIVVFAIGPYLITPRTSSPLSCRAYTSGKLLR